MKSLKNNVKKGSNMPIKVIVLAVIIALVVLIYFFIGSKLKTGGDDISSILFGDSCKSMGGVCSEKKCDSGLFVSGDKNLGAYRCGEFEYCCVDKSCKDVGGSCGKNCTKVIIHEEKGAYDCKADEYCCNTT